MDVDRMFYQTMTMRYIESLRCCEHQPSSLLFMNVHFKKRNFTSYSITSLTISQRPDGEIGCFCFCTHSIPLAHKVRALPPWSSSQNRSKDTITNSGTQDPAADAKISHLTSILSCLMVRFAVNGAPLLSGDDILELHYLNLVMIDAMCSSKQERGIGVTRPN